MHNLEEETIQINSHNIAYFKEGNGSPTLLIHGIPTSKQLWRNIIPRLAEKRKIVAPDMLNYGNSDKPQDANVSIEAQSRLMLKLLDSLGLDKVDIVAHDIGGGVAQIFAVNYPERLGKLVLIDSVCFDSWPIPEFKPLQEEGAEEKISLDEFVNMLKGFMPRGVYNKEVMTDDVIDLYLNTWSSEEGKKALFRNLRRLNPEYTQAIAGELKHLPHETLVIWAEHDEFQKPEYGVKLKETIPNSRLIVIEDTAHWLTEEKPDEIGDNIESFLGR